MTKKDSKPYWDQPCIVEDWQTGDRGQLTHQTMKNQRGFLGSKIGPANAGRRLSDVERKKIEDEMRRSGKL